MSVFRHGLRGCRPAGRGSCGYSFVELLVVSTIGLWLGHRNEQGLRPVLQDLQVMMIGPAWLLSVLYRRVGIPF